MPESSGCAGVRSERAATRRSHQNGARHDGAHETDQARPVGRPCCSPWATGFPRPLQCLPPRLQVARRTRQPKRKMDELDLSDFEDSLSFSDDDLELSLPDTSDVREASLRQAKIEREMERSGEVKPQPAAAAPATSADTKPPDALEVPSEEEDLLGSPSLDSTWNSQEFSAGISGASALESPPTARARTAATAAAATTAAAPPPSAPPPAAAPYAARCTAPAAALTIPPAAAAPAATTLRAAPLAPLAPIRGARDPVREHAPSGVGGSTSGDLSSVTLTPTLTLTLTNPNPNPNPNTNPNPNPIPRRRGLPRYPLPPGCQVYRARRPRPRPRPRPRLRPRPRPRPSQLPLCRRRLRPQCQLQTRRPRQYQLGGEYQRPSAAGACSR